MFPACCRVVSFKRSCNQQGGVDVTRKKMGGSGRYALQAAVEKGHLVISELLADAGCRFDTKLGKNNKTPFMLAVDKKRFDIAKLAVRKVTTKGGKKMIIKVA